MTFHIITIFPQIFDSYFNEGILKRAKEAEKVDIKIYNFCDFATDKHKTVDDTPYGGGPGMVLKVEPIFRCLEKIKSDIQERNGSEGEFPISNSPNKAPNIQVILTSAKGKEYTQTDAERLKKINDVIIICGRYEGVDERVAENLVDEEISIGKYVLTGGEAPAMVIVDSVSRLLPGVLGNEKSLESESYSSIDNRQSKIDNLKDYPVFTKPEDFQGWKVPEVLLSGNHAEIEKWRQRKSNIKMQRSK